MTASDEAAGEGFSAEWLALREPADARARDAELTAHFAANLPLRFPAQRAPSARPFAPLRFVDLACGTGANRRYLAPRVSGAHQWLLVDRDASLLEKAKRRLLDEAAMRDSPVLLGDPARLGEPAALGDRARVGEHASLGDPARLGEPASLGDPARLGGPASPGDRTLLGARGLVETQCLDLSTELHTLDFASDTVVTASALLDLVSEQWLLQLVEQCRAGRCTALFGLSYDGRITLTPSDPDDEWVRELVNRHQLGDKGFGPALGPRASQRTRELFGAAGYQVRTARSDWHLLPTERQLQQTLLEGWANAVTELAPNEADRCAQWLARRLAHLANQTSHIIVGHEDVLATPHA